MTGTGRKTHLFVLPAVMILSALAAILVYSNIYTFPFVYDDVRVLTNNNRLQDLAHYDSPAKFFTKRALVWYTFALNYRVNGLRVFGYHLVNVIVHVVSGWIVLFLSLTLLKSLASFSEPVRWLCAAAAALVFTVHPVQTQAVTYTVQRFASMAALFYMASVAFYLAARLSGRSSPEQGSVFRYLPAAGLAAASALSAAMAMVSKENAASLPAVLLLVEYLAFEKNYTRWKKKIPWIAAGLAVWVVFILLNAGFISRISGQKTLLEGITSVSQQSIHVGRWSYLCTQFNVLVIYLRLLFLPIRQNLDYLYHFKKGFFDGVTPLAFLLLCGLLGLGMWLRKKHPVVTFSILWFFITLSVESSVIPIHDAVYEHRLYLPMFGYSLLITYLLFTFLPKKRLVAGIICSLIILSLSLAAYQRNWTWQSELTLWSDVTEKAPHNNRGWYNLGLALHSTGRLPEAETAYRTSIQYNSEYDEAYNNLGALLCQTGRHREAIVLLKRALEINEAYADAYNNLGNALYSTGKKEEAVASYKKALAVNPDKTDCYGNLGRACLDSGRYGEAVSALKQAVQWYPEQTRLFHYLGKAHYLAGQKEEAIDSLQKVLDTDAATANTYFYCANAFLDLGRRREAIEHYQHVLDLDPGHASTHTNLAVSYYHEQRFDLAVKHCDLAEELGASVPQELLESLKAYRQFD